LFSHFRMVPNGHSDLPEGVATSYFPAPALPSSIHMRSMMVSINFRQWALSAWMTPSMSSFADCDTCSTLKCLAMPANTSVPLASKRSRRHIIGSAWYHHGMGQDPTLPMHTPPMVETYIRRHPAVPITTQREAARRCSRGQL
jgi:hypothetical protein